MVPSSPWLKRRIVSAASPSDAHVVAELGPGTGGTTRALLEAMPADSQLLSLEVNERFVEALEAIPDERLIPVGASATELETQLAEHGLVAADVVVSGIPFSRLDKRLGAAIVEAVNRCLTPGGVFVAYQLSRRVARLSEPVFGPAEVSMEWRSLPPIRVFRWQKASA
jgi:phospholipid N-methyltransferase